jgi:hypothetical protein
MSLFIEVNSVEKGCKVIINVEHITEVAPLATGGCALFFADGAAVGGLRTMKVSDSYTLFQQLVMQMVSADDIANRFPVKETTKAKIKESKTSPMPHDFEIPKL